ncbi:MAG TPA: hypothetical protein VIW24_20050 [Aldersonia sp.]
MRWPGIERMDGAPPSAIVVGAGIVGPGLHIPFTADAALAGFLIQFAANCRRSSWKRAVCA